MTHDPRLHPDELPAEALSGADRDARIEQLLLGGLDSYFAGHYEQAINLWTRVLFLDRHHSRARAYIERARSAQAERQRESEAVLHQGIAAFQAGDVADARRLLADALDRGVAPDEVHALLDRIERLGAGRPDVPPIESGGVAARAAVEPPQPTPTVSRQGRGWTAALLLVAAAVGILAVAFWGLALPDPSRWPLVGVAHQAAAPAVFPMPAGPLPQAAPSEAYLARARALMARGHLRDALREIDRVPVGDRGRADADRLRADIQRHLLSLAEADGASPPPE